MDQTIAGEVKKNQRLHQGPRDVSDAGDAADGDPRHGVGPVLYLLFQQPGQPFEFHLRYDDHPCGLNRDALLYGVAPDRRNCAETDGHRI